MAFEENTSNITQALSNLFEEMLLATEESNDNRSNVDVSQFLSALKERSSKHTDSLDFGTLVKLVDGWRTKLNLTKPSEPSCNYCEGNFRDFILAYNSIHGYVSLIVCIFLYLYITLKTYVHGWTLEFFCVVGPWKHTR